ncbi:flagellar basal body P-ring protein FlgI [bacterium]|nr:flagellar basal body P-ring protein FlgI [bacterium]
MKDTKKVLRFAAMAVMLGVIMAAPTLAIRIKDVTRVEGIRANQLIGYGLVVGLNGTGDGTSTKFTVQSLAAFLKRNGVTIDPDTIRVDNCAAVIVTADLQPFARPGSRLDVAVSTVGDADSLLGGTLLMTPLKGPDGQVYAVAQGAVSTGGYSAQGGGTSTSKNHPTAGKVPGGALVEVAPPTVLAGRKSVNLVLNNPDFTTAQRIATAINTNFNTNIASPADSGAVSVTVPANFSTNLASFMAEVERLPVHPDQPARIIIDERTGTVVMGEDVRISTLALTHGNLMIRIEQTNDVSQPMPYSRRGETVAVSNVTVKAGEDSDRELAIVPEGVSLGEVVNSLNAIGVTPRDLISILQAIKSSGALQAELEIK